MRILHFRASQGFYGAETVVLTLAKQQMRIGHGVSVISLERAGRHAFSQRLSSTGIRVHALPSRGRLDLRSGVVIKRLISDIRPDIVNSHGYKTDVMLAALRPFLDPAIAIVATNHNWTGDTAALRLYEALDAFVLRRFDRVIAVSTVVRDEMAARSIPRNRIAVVENGLDYSDLDGVARAELRNSINAGAGDLLVGFIGRLSPPKGLPFLVEAAGKLSAISNLHFVLIGEGPLRSQLRHQIYSRRLEKSVHLIGHRDDVPALLREIDLLVLPSLREGTPVVLLEAMAAGIPVIATDVGGVSRLIEHGSTGRLVPPGDADALATEIRRWLDEPGDRVRVGARAREVARSQFTSERMAQGYDSIYCAASAERKQWSEKRASRSPWMFPSR